MAVALPNMAVALPNMAGTEDLRDELLRRMLQAAIDDPRPRIPHEEVCSRMERWLAEPRAEAARWEKIAP